MATVIRPGSGKAGVTRQRLIPPRDRSTPGMPAPLEGMTILDFTRYQQGPFATVMLSDMGADVIKVEERTNGDLGRALGAQPDGFCGYFEAHNRNKRSITLDVRTDE